MPEQLWFTAFLNHYLAAPITAMLTAIHLPPKYPEAPVTNFVAMQLVVFGILLVLFIVVRLSLSVDQPGAIQHVAEVLENFVDDQGESIIGHGSRAFTPFLATLFIFILVGNLIGVIPGFESPTGNPSVPLGFALTAFVYYNLHGLHKQGLWGYFKHFLGPVWWLAFLMFPIEILSHIARMFSLTVRLYANMFAGDELILVFMSLVPILLPTVFIALHIGVSLLQAYIFMVLAMAYLQGAVAVEH